VTTLSMPWPRPLRLVAQGSQAVGREPVQPAAHGGLATAEVARQLCNPDHLASVQNLLHP
jgi:hypothetical protein